ncbi:MAG: hypothetical protein JWM28_3610 [Chitinophagaceae bacterium]|nr:hypothetical protein [Chitinophagaceae bacterium]
MKSKDKQDQIDKLRIIILQTLEYLIEHYTGSFVLDNYDPSRAYFLQEKKQVETYYKQGRLDRIKAKLATFTQNLCLDKDITYQHYIEERTGYRIDLYDELKDRANKILHNGIITNIEELADIEFMILLYRNDPNSSIDVNLYQNMLDRYKEANVSQVKVQRLYTQEEVFDINDRTLKGSFDNELKRQQGLIYKVDSPNGKNWVALHDSGKNEFALTYLIVCADGSSGSVYSAKGKNLPIKAYWKNDSTILIETSNNYETLESYKRITTKSSNISIRYIDNSAFAG